MNPLPNDYCKPYSINDMIWVTLTQYGVEVLKEHYDKNYPKGSFESLNIRDSPTRYHPSTNSFRTELWSLMHIFGDKIYLGSKQVFSHNQFSIVIDPFM